MKFDTVIIGGGLSGLVCGILLSKQGQRCVVISSGQSALHFSSGSFDLLNTLPDGTRVENPVEAVKDLICQAPEHPYVKLGEEKFAELVGKVPGFLKAAGITVIGNGQKNNYRISPMGTLKPTWLTLTGLPVSEKGDSLPWKKVAIFNIVGFLDFYTQFIADEFRKAGTESSLHLLNFNALEHLRKNPSEMRSANIARVFDKQENLDALVELINRECDDSEAVLLPAIIGLNREDALEFLRQKVGKPIFLLSTLPPSVPGIHAQQQLRKYFQQCGGVYMLGDTVLRAECEGNWVSQIYSYNHGDIPFVGKNFVLATGGFFSQGLIAAPDRVYEPVFGLDVAYEEEREQWYDLNLFARQNYQSFGVKTDWEFRGLRQGKPIENLYAAGAILEGFNPIKEGCGAGVSILTSMRVAEQILKQ
ncbi:MAG: glycerol-3-phosphate dehydrogenase subunit GlpB [Odoribacter sp.]